MKTGNKLFCNLTNYKYLERNKMNKNCMHEEIKNRIVSGNTLHYSFQNILSFPSLFMNIKMKKVQE